MANSAKDIYLAQNYLSGPKSDAILERNNLKKKKKTAKKKDSNLLIDDDNGFGATPEQEEDDVIAVESHSNKFKSIGGGNKKETKQIEDSDPRPPKEGGLKSAKQVKLENKQLRDKEREEFNRDNESMANNNHTVHRDASGRVIDVEREQQLQKHKQAQIDKAKSSWGKGLVQRGLEGKKEDDASEIPRWNDPGRSFIKQTRPKSNKPQYKGPQPPPNRFNIKPGYRWDGVDRSNGFEKKLFNSINDHQVKLHQHAQWSRSDM